MRSIGLYKRKVNELDPSTLPQQSFSYNEKDYSAYFDADKEWWNVLCHDPEEEYEFMGFPSLEAAKLHCEEHSKTGGWPFAVMID